MCSSDLKYDFAETGSSCHVHSSLWHLSEGAVRGSAFDGGHGAGEHGAGEHSAALTDHFRMYLAGQLAAARDQVAAVPPLRAEPDSAGVQAFAAALPTEGSERRQAAQGPQLTAILERDLAFPDIDVLRRAIEIGRAHV